MMMLWAHVPYKQYKKCANVERSDCRALRRFSRLAGVLSLLPFGPVSRAANSIQNHCLARCRRFLTQASVFFFRTCIDSASHPNSLSTASAVLRFTQWQSLRSTQHRTLVSPPITANPAYYSPNVSLRRFYSRWRLYRSQDAFMKPAFRTHPVRRLQPSRLQRLEDAKRPTWSPFTHRSHHDPPPSTPHTRGM
jgi:hypothetical protein